jgi:hypothetical protein
MAEGLATATANSLLDALFNATNYSVATPFIKLHIGAPGAAGTGNPAAETTRKAVSCSAAASGAITSDADIVWTNVAGSEDYTHWSIWTASSGGTFVCSGTMTANAVVTADTFTIPAGDLDASFPVAS